MADPVADMLTGAPAGAGPGPAPKDDPVYQMLTEAAGGPAPAPDAGPAAAPADAPAPAAPAGPSRPRGQARLPPPAPKPPGAPPGGPVDAKEDLSPGAVWSGALENALPSAMNQISQTVKPFLDWKGDAQLAHTLFTNPGAVGSAIAQVYGPRYDLLHPTREGGILQTLKHDPAAPLSDAAAVASLLTGGELLAPKLAGTAGDVANIVGKVGRAGQFLDPAYAAAYAAGKPLATAVRHAPEMVGGGLGATLGAAVPIPGAHLATSLAGERIGERLGKAGAQALAPVTNAVMRGVGNTRRAIPALTAASGLVPMSPEEQARTPVGGGSPEAPAGGPPGGGGGQAPDGPQLDPRYADDPVYAMLMGASGGGGGAPASLAGAAVGAPPPAPKGAGYSQIASIAQSQGATPTEVSTLQHIAKVESGGDPNATSPSGRYHGWFQYPWQGGAGQQVGAALNDLRQHAAMLGRAGLSATVGNLYLLHQQGLGGGMALLHAAPGERAIDAIARFYSPANALQAIGHNIPGVSYRDGLAMAQNMTAQEFVNRWYSKLGGGGGEQVPFADGGRAERAGGGQVVDMTEKLLQRANMAQKAAQAATKPLLGLSDDTVAQALRTAQRGI